ncbi:MAG: ATP-binding cassette domain-containing protein [Firmicutes bacterium]|nr:ATP-binding cassette domain-containing protein [Bacillota bacterium]
MSLVIRDLELRRCDGVRLLGPLNLNLAPGERVALVGESGSGKSLLARAAIGALPTGVKKVGGSVTAFGQAVPQARPGVAWMPQDVGLLLHPLVRLGDLLTTRTSAPVEPWLQRLGLPTDRSFLKRFPHQISGGQRQRVALILLLAPGAELLLLDEPTSALDPEAQGAFMALMEELRREHGLGWLWITHDLQVAETMAERIVVLYGGEALEAGSTSDVLQKPRHPYTQRLQAAHRGLPASETGFLEAPQERHPGCPFQPRCPQRRLSCSQWAPWQGTAEIGLRCETASALASSIRPWPSSS